MTRPKKDVEAEFLAALDRLKSGTPTVPSLIARARTGKVRITISSVALEAGRSRTLIGMATCQFPAVRKAVLDAARKQRVRRVAKDSIPSSSYSHLQRSLKAADTLNASLVLELEREREKTQRALRQLERVREGGGSNVVPINSGR